MVVIVKVIMICNESGEHPISCSYDRNKCKLMRTISAKYDKENIEE